MSEFRQNYTFIFMSEIVLSNEVDIFLKKNMGIKATLSINMVNNWKNKDIKEAHPKRSPSRLDNWQKK